MRYEMIVPSGRRYSAPEIKLALTMEAEGTIGYLDQPIRLNSGAMSYFYARLRNDVTDKPSYNWQIGSVIAEAIAKASSDDPKKQLLIGIAMAGNILAASASAVSFREPSRFAKQPFGYRQMRPNLKDHGPDAGVWVDGIPDHTHYTYWAVENVFTTGKGLFDNILRLEHDGYPPKEMRCFIYISRNPNCRALVTAHFKDATIGFEFLDLIYVLVEQGRWPKQHLTRFEQELADLPPVT